MLTIICGEDIVTSRNYFTSIKNQYSLKGYEINNITHQDIDKLLMWLGESVSLFSQKKLFSAENLNKYLKKKADAQGNKILEELKKIEKSKAVELIVWEGIAQRELKLVKTGKVKEFKPSQTIFKLLDSLYPGNKTSFVTQLNNLNNVEDTFIFIMLTKHVRNLILVKEGEIPQRMQSWQIYKLKSQLKYWKIDNLINFYEALFKIEMGSKTSSSPYSIKESLEILACHFL